MKALGAVGASSTARRAAKARADDRFRTALLRQPSQAIRRARLCQAQVPHLRADGVRAGVVRHGMGLQRGRHLPSVVSVIYRPVRRDVMGTRGLEIRTRRYDID